MSSDISPSTKDKQTRWSPAHVVVLLWPAALLLILWPTALSILNVWGSSPSYSHGYYIAPISLGLLWWQLRGGPLPQPEPITTSIWPIMLIALIWGAGHILEINLLQHFSLVLMLIVGLRALTGPALFNRHLFPICFLAFMIPFGDEIVPVLQTFTADFIIIALRMFNIPVLDDGIYLTTPAGLFEVAEACAGLRFLLATIMVGTLFSWVSYKSMKKRLTFVTICLVVPVFANAIRATLIVLIATWTNKEQAVGFDHLVYGWGFFAVILIVLLGIGTRYADRPLEELKPPPYKPSTVSHSRPFIVLAILTGIAMITRLIGEFI